MNKHIIISVINVDEFLEDRVREISLEDIVKLKNIISKMPRNEDGIPYETSDNAEHYPYITHEEDLFLKNLLMIGYEPMEGDEILGITGIKVITIDDIIF